MWTRNLCLICIYILRYNAFQITNEASFLAFLQPAATRLKFLLSSSSHLSKTSSAYSFKPNKTMWVIKVFIAIKLLWAKINLCLNLTTPDYNFWTNTSPQFTVVQNISPSLFKFFFKPQINYIQNKLNTTQIQVS